MSQSAILLTAFEPFGQFKENVSWEAIRVWNDIVIDDYLIHSICLPSLYGHARRKIESEFDFGKYAAVIAFGMSRYGWIAVERIALNQCDSQEPDNAGVLRIDAEIHPGGPEIYRSRLPVRTIVRCLQRANLPARQSFSAGTFICNEVFYGLMASVTRSNRNIPAGFIHLPTLEKTYRVIDPDFPASIDSIDDLRKAIRLIVGSVISFLEKQA